MMIRVKGSNLNIILFRKESQWFNLIVVPVNNIFRQKMEYRLQSDSSLGNCPIAVQRSGSLWSVRSPSQVELD